ncbi:MAG: GDSL-type esterase/lipase family protein [Gemmataceae bacterium]
MFRSIVMILCFASFASGADPSVVSLGDSITRGERSGVKKEETFSSLLAARLKVDVANVGIGGERTDGALARLDRDVLAKKPKAVLVMYGTNDSYVDKGAKAPRLSAKQYRENLVALVERIRKAGAEPILMTEPRWAKNQKNGIGEDPNSLLEVYVEVCRAVAKEHTVPLVDHYKHWKDAEAKGTVLQDWTTDGCHPNPRGHEALADLIEPVLKKALK